MFNCLVKAYNENMKSIYSATEYRNKNRIKLISFTEVLSLKVLFILIN